ncbi:arylesterase [Ectothiorhodospira shaposhnikovii]|uniref:arylesterase n=1 Tax=Ectothiorhodospira shaposhnikovii TaxID=1054 RepID=UPI001EE7B29A|nr:arylesterase [Ectothiorhodospira shaposhnikovii]MCG5512921.1 arylesterase [Ectothiorhodospira shaposhnikovii]
MGSRLLFFLCLLCLPAAAAAERPALLIMGDSLSAAWGIPVEQGWVALLERRLEESGQAWTVVNASISGETSRGGLTRLPRALERHQPELVIISLGGNDGLRGIALGEIRENLSRMIRLSRDSGAEVLLVGMQVPPNLGRHFTERFHRIYHELAEEYQVPLVPFLLEGVALEPDLMQADGIHPTAEAQPIMLDTVWTVLEAVLE